VNYIPDDQQPQHFQQEQQAHQPHEPKKPFMKSSPFRFGQRHPHQDPVAESHQIPLQHQKPDAADDAFPKMEQQQHHQPRPWEEPQQPLPQLQDNSFPHEDFESYQQQVNFVIKCV
jgi:hypothetical protein